MKAIYHLKATDDGGIVMDVDVQTPTGVKHYVTTSKQRVGTLTQLHSLCRNNIGNLLWRNNYGSGNFIEWDEDPTDILSLPIIGLSTYKKKIKVEPADLSDMVYEVIKVDNNWTVIKHDAPLLTWDEAVAELKKRI